MYLKATIFLNNDIEMPLLGLGTYRLSGESEVAKAVSTALDSGYRLIDTASVYKNEEAIGKAIARSGVPRSELFITTKLWNTAQRLNDITGAFQRSLERLHTDYVDLYMIHWPVPGCYLSSWLEICGLLETGRVRAVGVCNFDIRHLEELKSISGIVPAVNQFEYHPLWNRKDLVEYCTRNNIQVQASAPLARGGYLDHDVFCVMGTKYACSPAQIGLRWAVQKGIAVVPGSSDPKHIRSNSDIFRFSIDPEDMELLEKVNENYQCTDIPEDLQDVPF